MKPKYNFTHYYNINGHKTEYKVSIDNNCKLRKRGVVTSQKNFY